MNFGRALRNAWLAAAATFLFVGNAHAAIQSRYNLPPPASKLAQDIYALHDFMLIICGAIFVLVFGVMFYSIWKHRKSKGAVAANWHENTTVEIVWTVIPFIIIILMALPATRTVVAMKDTSNADLTVKATGYQWQWGYDYIRGEGEGIGFLSRLATPRAQIEGDEAKTANYLSEVTEPLVVPVNRKVRVITTANDVIHSWGVPALGVKQDAIPGFTRDAWFRAEQIGTYYGRCYELCGKDHAFMPIAVQVVSAEDYTKWVASRKQAMAALADDPAKAWTQADLVARGEKVYQANCQACHQPTGLGAPPAFPALAGSKVVANTPELVQILLNGRNAMPSWKALSDVELSAVATHVKSSFGNKGGAVQPTEFRAARK
ncbi:MAG TPA: cytochrome c oxidase subunit II [Burkholderiaceae bacterium]|nr:cytochrome c oxidase subunit II [Burkholderiaceae bacterium]